MPLDSAVHFQQPPPINSWNNEHQNAPNLSLQPATQLHFQDISSYRGGLEHPWNSGLRWDLVAVAPRADLNDGTPRHPEHRSASLPSRTINSSSVSVQSNLFTHSWHRPSSMALTDLASYIDGSPTAHIILLKWCKDLKGVPHEFLLFNVELQSADRRTLWLRLDRRSHRDATTSQLVSSTSASADSATVSEIEDPLFDSMRHRIEVQTAFTTPPPLETLRALLFILMEESPNYKLFPVQSGFPRWGSEHQRAEKILYVPCPHSASEDQEPQPSVRADPSGSPWIISPELSM
ncbi:hypothetical protein BS47DRAFT_1402734 [Hydnum rufescens UP504]|uniref:Uncharacterized protein n=1 Tax=Hydnum rufescens UP504 TaxID=1448309 RepID=A0A9P6ACK3_9AGAM|nr:hypothetical protein BS47DRAFT_1402734 [Hydnum rufescens UP504]